MRKKVVLLLIVVLGVLLTLSLVACNTQAQDPEKLPDTIQPGGLEDSDEGSEVSTYLTFSFPSQANSIFKPISIADFDLSAVQYCVVQTNGVVTIEKGKGALSEDMLDEESKQNIKKSGHHMIKASLTLEDGTVAKGSFELHLKAADSITETVTLTFSLTDADSKQNAVVGFGSTDVSGDKATVIVEKGFSLASWSDFVNAFPMRLEGKALKSVSVNNKEYDSTNISSLVFSKNTTIQTNWTDNVYTVTFNTCVPRDAVPIDASNTLAATITESVERGKTLAAKRNDDFNLYNGYTFSGWYIDNGSVSGEWDEKDTAWSFSQTINNDTSLVARWTSRAYSFTLYTMGGGFANPDNIQNSIVGGIQIASDTFAAQANRTVIDTTSRFALSDGALQSITMTGFSYGHSYSEYVMKVKVSSNSDRLVYLTLEDIFKNLSKGSGEYLKLDGIYADYQCSTEANTDKVAASADGSDGIGYAKWVFNENAAGARIDNLGKYYTEVLFKDGISIKADGSIRLDKISDESVNEIIIPAQIMYNGTVRDITEISAKACMNLKALVKLDMSGASKLTTIGKEAFKHCPHLSEVILPTDSSIDTLGRDIFGESLFEKNYATEKGSDAIIINKILYKYVGENKANIDLSALDVTRIADGAFESCSALESISFGSSITRIDNGAFADLSGLTHIYAPDALTYIGESAFDNTKVLTSASNCYDTSSGAIIIGRVYYRFIDKNATNAAIDGKVVNHIAPNALAGCTKLETITIYEESNLQSIGKNAFAGTSWLHKYYDKTGSAYVIKNGILCDYTGKAGEDIILPTGTRLSIIEDAFNDESQSVKTVQFGSNITKIDDYAFRGMTIVKSFIFKDISVGTGKLEGAPAISQSSFADSDGQLINNVSFYFMPSVMTYLEALESGSETTDDAITLSWLKLYRLNKDNFHAEQIKSVYIDNIPSKLLKIAAGDVTLSSLGIDASLLSDALVVENETGLITREPLDLSSVQLVLIDTTSNYSKYYEEGAQKYYVKFNYKGDETPCHIGPNDEHLLVITVVNAIKGNPTLSDTTAKNLDDNNSITETWYYCIDGFAQKEGAALPTFYTSFDAENHGFTFKYVDVDGTSLSLPIKSIEGFSVEKTATNAKAVFVVDFNGVCDYRFELSYNVEQPYVTAINQLGVISVPLNSGTEILSSIQMELVIEDGIKEMIALSDAGIEVTLDTSTLGMRNAEVSYFSDRTNGDVKQTIIYSVILEANEGLFEYKISSAGATITKCNANTATSIVIPATHTVDGREYDVIRIDNGVFENFTKLTSVYLTSKLTEIGDNAFKGCISLKNVYTAQLIYIVDELPKTDTGAKSEASGSTTESAGNSESTVTDNDDNQVDAFVSLTATNWSVFKDDEENDTTNIKITNLSNITTTDKKMLIIAPTYTVKNKSGASVTYTVTEVVMEQIPVGLEIALPDTLSSVPVLKDTNGNAVQPTIYSTIDKVVFRTNSYVAKNISYIGNNAFADCTMLESIDLSKATELTYIGDGAFAGSALKSIDLSSNTKLTAIGASTFEGCGSLEVVTLSENVVAIGQRAFVSCKQLTTIIAPGVTVVASDAYIGADKLIEAPMLS